MMLSAKALIDQATAAFLLAVGGGVLMLSMYSVAALSLAEFAKDKIRMRGKRTLKKILGTLPGKGVYAHERSN